jgi:PKHD-type hydroxylase
MQLKNLYWYFSSIIPKNKCEEIIEYGNSIINNNKKLKIDTRGVTFGDKHKQENKNSIPQFEKSNQQLIKEGISKEDVYVRDSEVAWLNDKWIYDLIVPIVKRANEESKWNFEIDSEEQIQFTTYTPGGFYSWHSDGGSDYHSRYKRYMFGISKDPLKEDGSIPMGYTTSHNLVGKIRKLSLTLNLSDPNTYKGGNLLFDFGEHSENVRYHECSNAREQGTGIVFPSFLPHCVTPLTEGKRYSLVLWTLGEPFK